MRVALAYFSLFCIFWSSFIPFMFIIHRDDTHLYVEACVTKFVNKKIKYNTTSFRGSKCDTDILKIMGFRGRKIKFTVIPEYSIDGMWRNLTDLNLSLVNKYYSREIKIKPFVKSYTSKTIRVYEFKSIEIKNEFIIPEDIPDPENQMLYGSFNGIIEYPERVEDTYGKFRYSKLRIDIPVELTLVPKDVILKEVEEKFQKKDMKIIYFCIPIAIIFLIIFISIGGFSAIRYNE